MNEGTKFTLLENGGRSKKPMQQKLVYLTAYPIDTRDMDRFGLNYFSDLGYQIRVIDITEILRPGFLLFFKQSNQLCGEDITNHVKNKEELKKEIKELTKNDVVIGVIDYSPEYEFVWSLLEGTSANFGMLHNGAIIPFIRFSNRDEGERFQRLHRIWMSLKKTKRLPWIVSGTKNTLNRGLRGLRKTKIVYTHNFDYDVALKIRQSSSLEANKYIVFLDEFYPYHPEYNYRGIEPPIDAEFYFRTLNRFLKHVEDAYSLPVIIAAHPRSWYDRLDDCFEGRKIIKGETAHLVKDCEIVLAHQSTSTNFANIFNKPVIFLDIDRIRHDWVRELIHVQSSWFGKIPINISNSLIAVDWQGEMSISEMHYEEYRERYIKMKSTPDEYSWQIFRNAIIEDL